MKLYRTEEFEKLLRDPHQVRKNLAAFMEKYPVSKKQLAYRIGISYTALLNFINKDDYPLGDLSLLKIDRYLQLAMEE